MKGDAFWIGVFGALTVVDVYCDRKFPEYTLSAVARRRFQVHTTKGQIVFVAGWGALSYWLIPHIILPAMQELADWTAEGTWGHEQSAA